MSGHAAARAEGPVWARACLIGLWAGLAYGLVEGVETMALLPLHALSWRGANGPDILWFAPLAYGTLFAAIGLAFGLVGALARSARVESALVFLLVGGGAFLAATLPGRGIADWGAAIFALGVGAAALRIHGAHRERAWRLVRRTLPWLAGVVIVAGVAVRGGRALSERSALSGLADAPAGAPNVLLIVIDTQRADHMSLHGYERATTPGLERLAGSSLVFDAAYANSSWTLPSHASLFTGRMPYEHGAGRLRRPYLDDRFPTLAEALRERGYATGGFVANVYWTSRPTGLDRGFIRFEDLYGNLGDALVRTVLGRRLAYEVLPRLGRVEMPGRKRADRINRDVLEWVDGLGDRPFFAFLNYFDVHGPYLPPPPFAGRFAEGDYAERVARQRAAGKIDIGALAGDIEVPPPEELQGMVDAYDESTLYLDAQLTQLFDALESRGLLDRTLVIVTSDHGESFGEHELMHHGHSLYVDQLQVPLLLRLPDRLPAGVRVPTAVGIDRIPATVLDLAGAGASGVAGRSLRSIWEEGDAPSAAAGETDTAASPVVFAEVARRATVPGSWPSSRGWVRAALTSRWHYILEEAGSEALFDLTADPDEERNLIDTPEGERAARPLRDALARDVGAGASGR